MDSSYINFGKKYHLFVPSISGHEREDIDFISSDQEAELILSWFQENGIEMIDLICGASLGAHIAVSILQKAPTFARFAFIESLKGYQYSGIKLKLFCYVGAFVMRQCSKTKGYMAGCYEKKYASDDCKETILNMSDKSLNNIMIESGNYLIRDNAEKIGTEAIILYGSKEKGECIKNTNILAEQLSNYQIIEIKDFQHGELAIGNPMKHLNMLEILLGKI